MSVRRDRDKGATQGGAYLSKYGIERAEEGTLVAGGALIAPHTSPSTTAEDPATGRISVGIPTSGANSPDPAQSVKAARAAFLAA